MTTPPTGPRLTAEEVVKALNWQQPEAGWACDLCGGDYLVCVHGQLQFSKNGLSNAIDGVAAEFAFMRADLAAKDAEIVRLTRERDEALRQNEALRQPRMKHCASCVDAQCWGVHTPSTHRAEQAEAALAAMTARAEAAEQFAREIRDGYDCDADAHRYNRVECCRCCSAEKLIGPKNA